MIISFIYLFCMIVAVLSGIKSLTQHPEILVEYPYLQRLFA